ncbi:oxidative stress defense protein [Vibrio sp. S9_S30]|uniref:oxidative stress defense protein n=1 Tax=Vibrio sp. S9_S30 TaxID=2720226 RepID=UPI0016809B24|nr:oxidative stress defense protein [Vibrio sp. S9_S30]MBD1559824.1 oxidative stress defense protein [Vibrio sp. S9_S30]
MKKLSMIGVLLMGVMMVPVKAEELSFPHISTSGYGEVTAVPDMAEFTVQVVETMLTAEQAKQAVDKTVNSFVERLTTAGVKQDNIASTNLYLASQYHYPKSGKVELVGYQASRSVTVTVEVLGNLNSYLDGALGDGINRIDDIQLKVKDESKYQEQARLAAIKDATQKATFLAKGFEREVDGVWKISYDNNSNRPMLMRSMALGAEKASNTYQDSSIVIRDRVDVTYKLKD